MALRAFWYSTVDMFSVSKITSNSCKVTSCMLCIQYRFCRSLYCRDPVIIGSESQAEEPRPLSPSCTHLYLMLIVMQKSNTPFIAQQLNSTQNLSATSTRRGRLNTWTSSCVVVAMYTPTTQLNSTEWSCNAINRA